MDFLYTTIHAVLIRYDGKKFEVKSMVVGKNLEIYGCDTIDEKTGFLK